MSKTNNTKCSIFLKIAFLIICINFCTTAPINVTENAYSQFIAELNRNKCSVPSQVQLPFDITKINNFEYLSSYLEICQKTESTKRNKEAVVLCKEIFDNIRKISCPTKTALPDINVKLSKNVCTDIDALKDSVPEDDKSLLKRLTDGFLCDIMCDSEFEKACQVLLWSFEVQKLISSVASPEESEQANVPEDGADINDSIKQDNTVDDGNPPQVDLNSENEKQNVVGEKDVNEVVGHEGITEIPEPYKLKINPEQKTDETATNSRNDKQEKPVPVNEAVLDNQGKDSKAEDQDLTSTSKSTSNLKTSSTLLQQTPVTSNSNTDVKPVEETTTKDDDIQNESKQLQDNTANMPVVKHDEVEAGDLSSGISNTNVASDKQTQVDNVNSVNNKQVQDKKDNIPPDGYHEENAVGPNIPLNDEHSLNNEIIDETSQKPNQNSNFHADNELHDSGNEKGSNDAAADLHNNEQNLLNVVDVLAQNKLQSSIDDKLTKKTDAPTTDTQPIKNTTEHKTIQESSLDKISITRVETESDQTQTDSDLKKIEPNLKKVKTQDQSKTDAVNHGLITDDGTKNVLTDQKKPEVVQQTEKFDNTIPDTPETSVAANVKVPEKNLKSKTTVLNPEGKSMIPSSLTETSTKTTVALEKMEGGSDLRQPADEEADHYGDLENTEDDYSRPEYDGGLYEGSKNKESNPGVPSPIAAAKEIINNQNERPIEFPSRNSFGQDSSDIQMIGFPEQEDSHFFFYFLSIVLILMAGYLLFHNKQKIIALIVEGRHERNRRSHRIGYKKLETK